MLDPFNEGDTVQVAVVHVDREDYNETSVP